MLLTIKANLNTTFGISPSVTLCNSRLKTALSFSFASSWPPSLLNTLMISNDTSLTAKSHNEAIVLFNLPCKKNLTFYRFQLYYQDDLNNPVSPNKASILTLDRYSLLNILQKNEKLFFEVDREIEFELITKSFDIRCELGNSSRVRVMVNEFH